MTIEIQARAGTRTFAAHDRLFVLSEGTQLRVPAPEVRAGDIVCGLGRVLAVTVLGDGTQQLREEQR